MKSAVAEKPIQHDQDTSAAAPRSAHQTPRRRQELLGRFLFYLPRSVWAVIDAAAVCWGHHLGYKIFHIQFPRSNWVADITLVNAVVAISFVVAGVICGLYESETLRQRTRIVLRSLLSISLALALAYMVMYALMYEVYSRRIALMGTLSYIGVAMGLRMLTYHLSTNLRWRVLLVGCGDSIHRICQAMRESEAGQQYELVGYVTNTPLDSPAAALSIPSLGKVGDLLPLCQSYAVHEVVIGVEEKSTPDVAQRLMACLRLGCRVTNQPTFHERVFGEVPVDHIGTDWFMFADLDGHRAERTTLKRWLDFIFALLGLICSAPLWLLIALAVRLDGRGPIFYSQWRVGCHGRLFRLTKFRTMRVDAEINGHTWSTPGDPRVTRIGRLLRRTHLDELPQLWSILIGEMSVVGPRPERPEFVEELVKQIPYYDERHLVKPGLTGWAQINYRYGSSVKDAKKKLFLDLYYIKHMSLELDLIIIFRTCSCLFYDPHTTGSSRLHQPT
ncbi:MAG: hypothetical protein HJJLKODD_01070 [Phycisphaerae bacterium]|nr:hypothetical protein [Phycisphaerae bacterium]